MLPRPLGSLTPTWQTHAHLANLRPLGELTPTGWTHTHLVNSHSLDELTPTEWTHTHWVLSIHWVLSTHWVIWVVWKFGSVTLLLTLWQFLLSIIHPSNILKLGRWFHGRMKISASLLLTQPWHWIKFNTNKISWRQNNSLLKEKWQPNLNLNYNHHCLWSLNCNFEQQNLSA